MSHDSGIRLYYSGEITTEKVIYNYLDAGWSLDNSGYINFIPLGDKGCFNWTALTTSERDKVFAIIKEKMNLGEVIGLTLIWGGTDVGVDALFHPDHSILFSLSMSRVVLETFEFTDVSWYLPKLLMPLSMNNITVEYVEWSEHV